MTAPDPAITAFLLRHGGNVTPFTATYGNGGLQ
jgi:hypothetical protein